MSRRLMQFMMTNSTPPPAYPSYNVYYADTLMGRVDYVDMVNEKPHWSGTVDLATYHVFWGLFGGDTGMWFYGADATVPESPQDYIVSDASTPPLTGWSGGTGISLAEV